MNVGSRIHNSQPSDSLTCFKVNLAVKYQKPQAFNDPVGQPLVAAGYFRKFVVVATSEDEVRSMLVREVVDGQIDWQDSEIERMSAHDFAEYSIRREEVLTKPNVVFRSSHFLYP